MNQIIKIHNSELIQFDKKSFKDKICLSPFISIEVDIGGNVRLCGCAEWMPSTVGNIYKSSINEILSNSNSKLIRESIVSGDYRYCNEKSCGIINNNQLNDLDALASDILKLTQSTEKFTFPREILIAGDITCNLSCPSCRRKILKNSEDDIERLIELGNILHKNLFFSPSDENIRLHVSTSGEIFASPLLLSFVNNINLENFPNLKLCIQTNGLLAKKNWHKLGKISSRVEKITITTDAATASTYEKLRRGGKWKILQESLKWLKEEKSINQNLSIHYRMVAQFDNYKEIEQFYYQAKELGADVVEYSKLENWGTYSMSRFQQLDVFEPRHYEYNQAQYELNKLKKFQDVFLSGRLYFT
jgi:MoaA/NifB/PqqE/SkfB family radical SAM enzyme